MSLDSVLLMRQSQRFWLLALLALFALAVFLVNGIQHTYMISDEFLVYRFTGRDLGYAVWYQTFNDVHPPAWFAFFGVWRQMVGESEFAGRMQSVLFSLLTLALTYQIGRRWFGASRYGLFAMIVLGTSALFFEYGLRIRPYGLALLLASLSMYTFERWLSRRTWRSAIFYALTLPTMLFVHYFLGMVILAQALYLGILYRPDRRLLRQGVGVAGIFLVVWLPWMPNFLNQVRLVRGGEEQSGNARGLLGTAVTTQPTSWESLFEFAQLATNGQIGLYLLALLLGLVYGWRKQSYRLALTWALGLPLIAFMLNLVFAVYAPRYIVNFVVGLALALGVGLASVPGRARWVALAGFAALSLWGLPSQLPHDIIPYSTLFRDLASAAQPGDAILLDRANYDEDEVMRWQTKHYLPLELRERAVFVHSLADVEAALPTRRLWHVTAKRDDETVVSHYRAIEQSHPRQDGFGKCDRDWCYLIQLMEAPPWNEPQIFGEDMAFWGVDVDAMTREGIRTRLWWRLERTPAVDYSIGLHLLDAQGVLVAQADGPINHYSREVFNTSQLEPGRVYIDWRTLGLPTNLPSGMYQLVLIVYDWQTGERLLLPDNADSLLLDSVNIL